MGYYTNFSLTVCYNNGCPIEYEDDRALFRSLARSLKEINNTYFSGDHDLDFVQGYTMEWKWYDYMHDMTILSTVYPDLIFILTGEGEEKGDLWYKFFNNGNVDECYAEITYQAPTSDFGKRCLNYKTSCLEPIPLKYKL